MSTLRRAWARLVSFFRKQELDREFDEELAAHIELATQEHVRRGMSLAEARRLALIRLGGIETSKEIHRESRGLPWLDGIMQDMRYAYRGLRRSPGFTFTAIATLAVGIGVNAAVFTVTNAVLFKGPPFIRQNNHILYINTQKNGSCCVAWPDFQDWQAQAKSFEGMGAVNAVRINVSDQSGFAENYEATQVSANTFSLVGQKPIMGRDFVPSDETPGAASVAILSYGLWERLYGKDPAIIGHAVRMNGVPTTVIGIMPQGFSFPRSQDDLWIPLVPTPDLRKREVRRLWFVFGRMADGVTVKGARAEMETIGRRLANAYPLTNRGLIPTVHNFHEFFIGSKATTIYGSMWGAVSFVLLIACANLANLLLARSMVRSRETSIRIALGAGRWRIIRQLLIESVMLSSLGGVFGWWIAKWGIRAYELNAHVPGYSMFDSVLDYTVDYHVLAYLLVISIGSGLLFGLAPVVGLSKFNVNIALKDGGNGATGGRRGKRLSFFLVTGEMALAIVLLAGAGVMIRSFLNIYNGDVGVRTVNILTALFVLPDAKYPRAEARMAFYHRLKTRLEAIPGVESIAIADWFPTWGATRLPYEFAGKPPMDEQRRPILSALVISPAYFQTLGATVLAGRGFDDTDGASSVPVVIVNKRFAASYWPGENPLGKRLRLFDGKTPEAWRTVVGVVSNIIQADFTRQEFDPLIYLPYRQRPEGLMNVIVRTRVPPGSLTTVFRREVHALDADLPLFGPYTLAERLEANYWSSGLYAILFLIFAAIALLLASIGLYAVIAQSVSQRTQEIGVRMAIGATASDIRKLVFTQGLAPLGIGLIIGLMASLAVNRILKSQLVQVSPTDPITLVVASAVLVLSAVLGCLIPARRAMRVDPVVALRHE